MTGLKRVCVVGGGRWGQNHIRTLAEMGCLAGIVEANPGRLAELQEAYPAARAFADLAPALEAAFDGFVVASPAETHGPLTRRLLEAGFPVLVEKPMALSVAEACELKRLAAGAGLPLMVGHVMLFHPAIRRIGQLLREGKIGRLEYFYSTRVNLGTVRTEENILWSFAPHDISVFQHLIGRRPTEVVSRGGVFLQPGVHDCTLTILTYPGNVVGHIFQSWLHPFKEHRLVLIGSKGMLSFDDASPGKELLFYEKGIDWVRGEPVRRDGPTEIIPYEPAMPLAEELRHFLAWLDGSPPGVADADSAIEVLEILERATASLVGTAPPPRPAPSPQPPGVFVHPTSEVDEDVEIGDGTKLWHFSHVQSGARLGRNCTLGQNVNVGNNVRIGDRVRIQNNVSVYEGVTLEDDVFCGPAATFTNIRDPRSRYPQRGAAHYLPTRVREGASIGANATVLCGLTIGRHAMIGAGAVVTRDVPDYALMVGVPARRVGWACECGQVLPKFKARAQCPRCERRYELRDGRLAESVGSAPSRPGRRRPAGSRRRG